MQAMNELVARSRAADDEPVELDYLIDALEHYRGAYVRLLRRHEALYEEARSLYYKVRQAGEVAANVWRELEASYQHAEED